MSTHPLPPKKEVALALLERSSVHVHLDPRANGVVVPVWFKKQPQLVLQVGLNMPVPIPDLRLDEEGLSCTLSFNRSPFFCVVPWSSIYAMVGDDGRGMVWPDHVPPEVAQQTREPAAAKKPVAVKRVVAVAAVDDGHVEGASVSAAAAEKAPRTRTRDGNTKAAKKPRKRPRIVTNVAPEARGALVAVPPTPESPKRVPVPVAVPAPAIAHQPPQRPQEHLRRPTPQANGGPRPKRELPPYLRVVK